MRTSIVFAIICLTNIKFSVYCITYRRGMAMNDYLKEQFRYYIDHQNELVAKYNGKFIVIKDSAVIGAYNDELEAITETSKKHELGTFLVQKCTPGSEGYTQTFHSRVSFG